MGAMLGSLCMGAYGLVLAVNMLWAAGLMKLLSREAKESQWETQSHFHNIYTAKGWGTSSVLGSNFRTSRRFCHYLRSGPNRTK